MSCDTGGQPERSQFIRAGRRAMETGGGRFSELPRNCGGLDELGLVGDELDQGIDVDPVSRGRSFSLLI